MIGKPHKNAGNWEEKQEVMMEYDKMANAYDVLYREEQNLKIKKALKLMEMKKSDIILDVGCGTGLLIEYVIESVKFLVGLDISKEILKKARSKFSKPLNLLFIRADADFTPFPDETFDKVFAITLLQNMPNPQLTLKEIFRVTKKGSLTVVTGLKKKFKRGTFEDLLREAGFEILFLETDNDLRGYVTVCRKKINKTDRSQNM